MVKEYLNSVNSEDQDIINLGFDAATTQRFIRLRRIATQLVEDATRSEEGRKKLGRVMGFLNDQIESARV